MIFLGFCWYNLPPYIQSVLGDASTDTPANRSVIYAWLVILGSIALLMAVTAIGSRRWRAAGMDLDGKTFLADSPEPLTDPGRQT